MARKITESIKNTIQEAVQAIDLSPMEPVSKSNTITQAAKCGAVLSATREEQNLTIQEIATRLRLSVKQIEALEADHFTALPEPTIVRGFIRNYAKQLKIEAEPLLEAYSLMAPSSVPYEMIVKPSANMKMTSYKKPKTGLYGLMALAVVLGLGIWLFYQNYVQKPSPTKEITNIGNIDSANVEALALPLPEPALPIAEREAALQASTELTLPPPQEPASQNTTQPENAPAEINTTLPTTNMPPELKTPAAPVASTPEPTIEPILGSTAGTGRLEFSATQETWVSVIDGNGQEVYRKTIFAGSRETINAKLPVNITVGNAGATNLSMNGKSYDLAPYSRNNVAHIKLEK
jgi:cytoskeleton protein RodZ